MEKISIDVLQLLATLNPLEDRPLKLLLSDAEQFRLLAEEITEEPLGDDEIVDINGEIVFTKNGKAIHADTLRLTGKGFFNIDGQMRAVDFPYNRHMFYGSAIYVNGLPAGGDWVGLKPVTSIVLYKDKGETPLLAKATMAGSLIQSDAEAKQLTLVAVNTKKWREARTPALQSLLSTLHHGY